VIADRRLELYVALVVYFQYVCVHADDQGLAVDSDIVVMSPHATTQDLLLIGDGIYELAPLPSSLRCRHSGTRRSNVEGSLANKSSLFWPRFRYAHALGAAHMGKMGV